MRNGVTVSDAAELDERKPVLNFDRVAAWWLSPNADGASATTDGIEVVAFVEDVVEGVWGPRAGDGGERG